MISLPLLLLMLGTVDTGFAVLTEMGPGHDHSAARSVDERSSAPRQ